MDPTPSSTNNTTANDTTLTPTLPIIDHHQLLRDKYALPSSSYAENYSAEDDLNEDFNVGIEHVKMDQSSWAAGLPEAQGLYDPENEKDVSLRSGGRRGGKERARS